MNWDDYFKSKGYYDLLEKRRKKRERESASERERKKKREKNKESDNDFATRQSRYLDSADLCHFYPAGCSLFPPDDIAPLLTVFPAVFPFQIIFDRLT